jgi:hypothetical protein
MAKLEDTLVPVRPEGDHTMSSEVERAVEFRALEAMLSLAANPQTSTQARAIAVTSTISSSSGPPAPHSPTASRIPTAAPPISKSADVATAFSHGGPTRVG